MATAAQGKAAAAYASSKGYKEGDGYSLSQLPGGEAMHLDHRGHGGTTYNGLNNGCLEFRCGCGEAIWVRPS